MADGLLISCVASCSNLWALIMDAGTGFTSQVYELSPFFLHKVNCCSAFVLAIFLIVYCLNVQNYTYCSSEFVGVDHGTVGKELLH